MDTSPYRASMPFPTQKPRDASTWNALPLGVIAVTFFLPFTTDCADKPVSPWSECRDLFSTVWFATPFLVAAMLCAAIVHLALTKSYAQWLVLAGGALSGGSLSFICAATAVGGKPAVLVLCAPSVALFVFACKRRGSRQLGLVLDTYVVSSLPVAILAITSAQFYGAFMFAAAFGMLVVIRARAFIAWIRTRQLMKSAYQPSRT